MFSEQISPIATCPVSMSFLWSVQKYRQELVHIYQCFGNLFNTVGGNESYVLRAIVLNYPF